MSSIAATCNCMVILLMNQTLILHSLLPTLRWHVCDAVTSYCSFLQVHMHYNHVVITYKVTKFLLIFPSWFSSKACKGPILLNKIHNSDIVTNLVTYAFGLIYLCTCYHLFLSIRYSDLIYPSLTQMVRSVSW